MRSLRRRVGFTLIELLVVIAIIAILIGLLLPAVQKVREAAARMSCSNNLKQLGIALHSYHDNNNALPPGCSNDVAPFGNGGNGWGSSWKVYILPYIEQDNLFRQWQFNNNSGYVNGTNMTLINNVTIKVYRCPSSIFPATYNTQGYQTMFTSYTGVSGATSETSLATVTCCAGNPSSILAAGGILFPNSRVTMTGITDGTSNTILVGEQSDHLRDNANQPTQAGYGPITSQGPHGWAMGCATSATGVQDVRAFNCSTVRWPINQRGLGNGGANGTTENTGMNIPFSSGHTSGAQMLMGDGSVRFMTASTPLATLQAMATRANGEVFANP